MKMPDLDIQFFCTSLIIACSEYLNAVLEVFRLYWSFTYELIILRVVYFCCSFCVKQVCIMKNVVITVPSRIPSAELTPTALNERLHCSITFTVFICVQLETQCLLFPLESKRLNNFFLS